MVKTKVCSAEVPVVKARRSPQRGKIEIATRKSGYHKFGAFGRDRWVIGGGRNKISSGPCERRPHEHAKSGRHTPQPQLFGQAEIADEQGTVW